MQLERPFPIDKILFSRESPLQNKKKEVFLLSEIFFATKRKIMFVRMRLKKFSSSYIIFLPIMHYNQTMSSRFELTQAKNDVYESVAKTQQADCD